MLNYLKWLFNINKKKEANLSKEDIELIELAKEKCLDKTVLVSSGGGQFDRVRLIECVGIVEFNSGKQVRFKTNDSWVTHVSYNKEQILNYK